MPGSPVVRHGPLVLAVTMVLTLLVALHARSYMSSGRFETYEEGLPLSAGLSYLNGGAPATGTLPSSTDSTTNHCVSRRHLRFSGRRLAL